MSAVRSTAKTSTGSFALETEKSSEGQIKRLHHIPRPASKEAERTWLLQQMAGALRKFAKLSFADGSSGHISLRAVLAIDPHSVEHFKCTDS